MKLSPHDTLDQVQRNFLSFLPTILILLGAALVFYSTTGAGNAFRYIGLGLAVAGLASRFILSKRG